MQTNGENNEKKPPTILQIDTIRCFKDGKSVLFIDLRAAALWCQEHGGFARTEWAQSAIH